ncbi:MAG: hypothetical protein EOP51_18165 [Sphingobacteriales bacterium]|nr:MAG: hypothetical protein EOP51_18165 [Sphingobacteriales bacterium]
MLVKKRTYLLLLLCCLLLNIAEAQSLLNKPVTIDLYRKPLSEALTRISKQGGFSFSYNSNIVKGDSLVTVKVNNRPIHEVLDMFFGSSIEYKETANHIVLQKSPPYWYVSGYVVDELTGEKLVNASVYEKEQLVASLTDEQGYFKLKLRDRLQPAVISISKSWYSDTSLQLHSGSDRELTVRITPKNFVLDSVAITPNSQIEKTWLGSMFLSSRQRMQSMNLNKFFVDKPYQASVVPGVGTHGKMSAQVVNKFSFNLLGGYTAGVNGFEIGGVFNIVRYDVRYAHVAGVFNITGGEVTGIQVGGLYNHVLDTVSGVIVSGISNVTLKDVKGVDVGGLYTHVGGNMNGVLVSALGSYVAGNVTGIEVDGLYAHSGGNTDGVQVGGLTTYTRKNVDGTQVSGVANIAGGDVDGGQIAGLFNYAKRVDGVQIGLINIADTSSGYSIGLINVIMKGYHKLSLFTNESSPFNASFKTGNKNIYSILIGSVDSRPNKKLLGMGYGIGTERKLYKNLSLNPELSSEYFYMGDWGNNHLITKLQLNFNYRIGKHLSVYAGPSFNVYLIESDNVYNNYRREVFPNYSVNRMTDNLYNWIGWNVGIDIF